MQIPTGIFEMNILITWPGGRAIQPRRRPRPPKAIKGENRAIHANHLFTIGLFGE